MGAGGPKRVQELKIIKGFEYPVACAGMAVTSDKSGIITTGTYKPSIKHFSFQNLSMKFERHCAADPKKVVVFAENTDKFAVLRVDRAVEFHTRNGLHETVRISRAVCDSVFNPFTAELYFSGDFDSILSFNLEEGRFNPEISIGKTPIPSITHSVATGILCAAACDSVCFVDPRTRRVFKDHKVDGRAMGVTVSDNGINYLVGTVEGVLCEFDMRSPLVLHQEVHSNPVSQVKYNGKARICSTGTSITVYSAEWEPTVIEAGFEINVFDTDDGVVFLGGESESMRCYFVDGLGSIPSWCSDTVHQ